MCNTVLVHLHCLWLDCPKTNKSWSKKQWKQQRIIGAKRSDRNINWTIEFAWPGRHYSGSSPGFPKLFIDNAHREKCSLSRMIIRYITVRKSVSTRHTAEMSLCRMIIYSNVTCVLKGRNVTGWDPRATVSMRSLSCTSQQSTRIDANPKTHWRLPRSANWNPIETGDGAVDVDVGCTSRMLFRPIAGNINVCPRRFQGDRHTIDFDRLVSTIKHEILHTLVRDRDEENNDSPSSSLSLGLLHRSFCLLPRQSWRTIDWTWPSHSVAQSLRWKVAYIFRSFVLDHLFILTDSLQVYTPSELVLTETVRKHWKIRDGTIEKRVSMLVTPKVQVSGRL